MTGIERLREWAKEVREAARAYRDGEIGYVSLDVEECQRKIAARLDAIADQIEREIKEAVTDWADDEDDAFEDMRGARTGIEMLRSYVHNARVYLRNFYINYVADVNAVPLYETLRKCLVQLDYIADQVERETLSRPRFEDGEPVQFGDKYEAYGHVYTVERITFFKDRWIVSERFDNSNVSGGPLKRPEPPDSWERLAAEVEACDGSACQYLKKDHDPKNHSCEGCRAEEAGEDCLVFAMQDVLRRAKRLAGVE